MQGDILYRVNDTQIDSISQLQKIILENPDTPIEFGLYTECMDTKNCPIS